MCLAFVLRLLRAFRACCVAVAFRVSASICVRLDKAPSGLWRPSEVDFARRVVPRTSARRGRSRRTGTPCAAQTDSSVARTVPHSTSQDEQAPRCETSRAPEAESISQVRRASPKHAEHRYTNHLAHLQGVAYRYLPWPCQIALCSPDHHHPLQGPLRTSSSGAVQSSPASRAAKFVCRPSEMPPPASHIRVSSTFAGCAASRALRSCTCSSEPVFGALNAF